MLTITPSAGAKEANPLDAEPLVAFIKDLLPRLAHAAKTDTLSSMTSKTEFGHPWSAWAAVVESRNGEPRFLKTDGILETNPLHQSVSVILSEEASDHGDGFIGFGAAHGSCHISWHLSDAAKECGVSEADAEGIVVSLRKYCAVNAQPK